MLYMHMRYKVNVAINDSNDHLAKESLPRNFLLAANKNIKP